MHRKFMSTTSTRNRAHQSWLTHYIAYVQSMRHRQLMPLCLLLEASYSCGVCSSSASFSRPSAPPLSPGRSCLSPGRSCQHGAILVATSICAAPCFTPCVVCILIRYPSGSARCEPVPIPPWILATRWRLDHHPCPMSSSSSSSSSSCFPFSRSLSGRYRNQHAFLKIRLGFLAVATRNIQ